MLVDVVSADNVADVAETSVNVEAGSEVRELDVAVDMAISTELR